MEKINDLIHIPDAHFRSYLQHSFPNAFKGDKLDSQHEDIKRCSALDVSQHQISSMQGIECFIGLTKLNCSNNRLFSLGVSQNTALTDLHCSDNQLTSLDVSKNTALTDLNCSNNQLS